MDQLFAALNGAWQVLVAGLVLGAGLPALFAVGVNALAWGAGGDAELHESTPAPPPHRLGRIVAYAVFGVVLLAVLAGVGYITAHGMGYSIAFDGLTPVITSKK